MPFVILMIAELLYFKAAGHFNIIDKPNQRSSHTIPTIRGGGIIFILSVILFFVYDSYSYLYLVIAVMISGLISFWDDIRPLPNYIKFSAHLASVILVFKECGILMSLPMLYLIIIGILAIGVINAYNFMDGINGITGLYSLAVIFPLFITEGDDHLRLLDLFLLSALLVFNFFNTRKKARCFAGDVGSISLAILVVFLMLMRIVQTHNFTYAGLLLIYGIDSIYTIAQRIYQGENIFKPHRKHLYQYLSNERKIPQVQVSILFAFIQAVISCGIVFNWLDIYGLIVVAALLSIAYWMLKAPFLLHKTIERPGL